MLLEAYCALKMTHHHAGFNPHFRVIQRIARENFVAQYLVQSKHCQQQYSAKVYPKEGPDSQFQ